MKDKTKRKNDVIDTSVGAVLGINRIPRWVYIIFLLGLFILGASIAYKLADKPASQIAGAIISNAEANRTKSEQIQGEQVSNITMAEVDVKLSIQQPTSYPTLQVVEGGALTFNTPLPDKIFATAGPGLSLTPQTPQ